MLIFLGIATIIGESGIVGMLGQSFATMNISLFGYIGYIYLLCLLYPAYYFYKTPTFTFHTLELIVAWLLGFVSLLLGQSLLFHSGLFGNSVVFFLQNFIGIAGVWILVVGSLLLSILVATQSSIDIIFANIKHIFSKLYQTLRPIFQILWHISIAFIHSSVTLFKKIFILLKIPYKYLLALLNQGYILSQVKWQEHKQNKAQKEQEHLQHLQAIHNLDVSLDTHSSPQKPKEPILHTLDSKDLTTSFYNPQQLSTQSESNPKDDITQEYLHTPTYIRTSSIHTSDIQVVQDSSIDSEIFLQERMQEYKNRYDISQHEQPKPQDSRIQEVILPKRQEITQNALNNAYKTAHYGAHITTDTNAKKPLHKNISHAPLDIQAIIENSHQAQFTQAPLAQKPPKSSQIPQASQIQDSQSQVTQPHTLSTSPKTAQDILDTLNIQEIAQDSTTNTNTQTLPTIQQPTQTPHTKDSQNESAKAQDSRTQDSQESIQPPKVQIVRELDENTQLLKSLDFGKNTMPHNFKLPLTSLLSQPNGLKNQIDEVEIDTKSEILLAKLKTFKIDGDVVRTYSGPIVTTFEFRPAPNVKVSRILNLEDDLALALSAKSIRIQAPVPGKDVVGIEIPNNTTETIFLREILESDLFKSTQSSLTLALGKDIVGNPFVQDLRKLPHLLIAGTTGSGKSVGLNAMILSLLYKNSPDTLKLMMIDPKRVEFSLYSDIPHLITPIITDPKKAIVGLASAMHEMDKRYEKMKDMRVKEIESYNKKAQEEGEELMQYFVIVIDELADLMQTSGREAEAPLSRIAQMGRACGIHLIIATQRPSVDVVTGTLKGNLPSRISYKVGSKVDSKVILDSVGAESLLGKGDMLFKISDTMIRLHAPFSTEEEIESVVEFIKSQRSPQYDTHFLLDEKESILAGDYAKEEGDDDMLEQIKRFMLETGNTSSSSVQRRFSIGFNRATNYVEQLEKEGFLSKRNAKGVREIIR